MTKPKTDSEFDYSSINVMAIGVMAMIVIMIFFFFNPKQVIQYLPNKKFYTMMIRMNCSCGNFS